MSPNDIVPKSRSAVIPRVRRSRHHDVQDAFRHGSAMFTHEQIRGEAFRPMSETGDGEHSSRARSDHDRRDAAELHLVRVEHREGDPGSAAGIDGIAALPEWRNQQQQRGNDQPRRRAGYPYKVGLCAATIG
jgi:hypothetical protein